MMMRPKTQYHLNLKLLIFGLFLAFLLLFILRTNFFSSSSKQTQSSKPSTHNQQEKPQSLSCPLHPTSTCTKIPPSLVQALLHYTTSSITPQQTLREISVTSRVLERKSPCNFMIFGLGHDSLMWSSLNHGGRTIFVEEDKSWIAQMKQRFPTLESYHIVYDSRVRDADELMQIGKVDQECKEVLGNARHSQCQLALKGLLPPEVYEIEWDLIMVDAPTGYFEDAPGRMSAIYTAGLIARNREAGETDVFVHDVNRVVEDQFSRAFLCDGYMREQEGRLRHFTIPSHRANVGRPFCPEN
ncbi:glucuronoxylan 4-O-methyltransferase 3-like [Macadamia integrifolia]|uniref:glucuronoxylan 4-O-methyltransferase 3-like n=1 Tax=Macadamia integrifolia TaxID=60698 RepID=UPI001C4EC473|nr:glucuronoxylan 4-O-methyltransferase 3-like [Macadamia integrifolia]